MHLRAAFLCLLLGTVARPQPLFAMPKATPQKEGQELIGKPVRSWSELRWLKAPLAQTELRDRVVLVRFWSDACPMCSGALPSLQQLYEQHEKDGLLIVGIYHPKPARPIKTEDIAMIKQAAATHGVRFPVAIDSDWTVLRRWWLDDAAGKRAYTSASFLIDRTGVIRWVHQGGELHSSHDSSHAQCERDYEELLNVLSSVLRERVNGSTCLRPLLVDRLTSTAPTAESRSTAATRHSAGMNQPAKQRSPNHQPRRIEPPPHQQQRRHHEQ